MTDTPPETQIIPSARSTVRTVCIIWFVIGLVTAGGWVLATSVNGKKIQQLTQLTIFMDDKGCDSGFNIDWLNGASLIDFNGKKINELSFKGIAPDCLTDYPFISMSIAVEPTDNWIYRLSIPNASGTNSRDLIAIESLDPIGGPAEVFFSISLDCPAGVRVCL